MFTRLRFQKLSFLYRHSPVIFSTNDNKFILNPCLLQTMSKRSFSEINDVNFIKLRKDTKETDDKKSGYGAMSSVQLQTAKESEGYSAPHSKISSRRRVTDPTSEATYIRSSGKSKRNSYASVNKVIKFDSEVTVSPTETSVQVYRKPVPSCKVGPIETESSLEYVSLSVSRNRPAGEVMDKRTASSLQKTRLQSARHSQKVNEGKLELVGGRQNKKLTEEPGTSSRPRVTDNTILGNPVVHTVSQKERNSKLVEVKLGIKVNSHNKLFKNLKNKQPKKPKRGSVKDVNNVTKPSSPQNNPSKYKFEYLKPPIKSPKDRKEYKIIKLSNGLKAILVSDVRNDRELDQCEEDSSSEEESDGSSIYSSTSESASEPESEEEKMEIEDNHEDIERDVTSHRPMEEKLAAVGLTVGVGSFSDPVEIPGLAHFLEHMVFMGSAKFPKENDFDSFIRRHGGSDNAHTDFEMTTFYFECQDKHLLKGMDKFSQFFQNPLMKKEAMTREREAVESEFQESKSSDDDRIVQLLAEVAKKGHPATKFTWGNAITLEENVTDGKLHAALHRFRQRHYSAHRMTLAVQARLPMEILESLVVNSFSSIPNNSLPPDDFSSFKGSFDTPQFNRIYRVLSVKDKMAVMVTWPFPSFLRQYRSKPYQYLESVFDHEGRGTLLYYLRQKLWALELSSGESESGFVDNSMFYLFSVSITLTMEGYKHVNEVITAVFSYIAMLRHTGPCERFFRELQSMAEANFEYADEVSPADYVEQLSEALHFFEPEDCIAASFLMYDYDPQAIKDFQDALTPNRVNVIISSKDGTLTFDKEEKWFQTKYSVSEIPSDWLRVWETVKPMSCFHIPDPNIYIPTDFSLLPQDPDEFVEEYPIIIEATKLCEVWYKRDTKFKLPIAYYYLYLISPLPSTSPFNSVLLDIYASMLDYHLSGELYAARLGSISYFIGAMENGIKIRVGGFNEKLPVVLETILQHMASFRDDFNQDMFQAIKDTRTMMYYNNFIKPGKLNKELRMQLLMWRFWSCVNKHAAVKRATQQMLLDFVYDYHSSLYIQCLVQGNVTRQEALQACHMVTSQLKCQPIQDFQYPEFRVTEVDVGSRILRVKSFNQNDSNSVITNYHQLGLGTIRNSCILELVLSLMEEPLFNTLRTKEQLGYSVDCQMRDTHGVIGYTITINYQEDKFSVDHVDERIEAFLKTFSKTVGKMREKKLDEARRTLIKLKLCTDVYLKEECGRHWSEIMSNEYLFDRNRREVDCLNTITMKEVREWLAQHLGCGSQSNYRKLSIQVVGNPAPKKTDAAVEMAKKSSKHNLKIFNHDHPSLTPVTSQLSLPTLPQLPGPTFPLEILTPDSHGGRFIKDMDKYRQSLPIYPLHRILQ